jgi:L-asparaginase II
MRSLAKPFQALPLLTTGAAAAFDFGPEELALFCGSLSGQDFQVKLVEGILAKIGLNPQALHCGSHPPLHRPSAQALTQAGEKPTALHHTCAGKHAAMLALCVHQEFPLEDYLNPEHPVQRLIVDAVAKMVGLPPERIPVAVDGCGAPVFYVPLRHIALGFARLAGAAAGSPAALLRDACLNNPRHIAGDGRLETVLMEALPGRVVAKTGAEGGFALALVQEGLGVAVKIEDGSSRALNPTIIHVMEELGLLTPEAQEALAAYRQPAILNHAKQEVGRIRPVFSLI